MSPDTVVVFTEFMVCLSETVRMCIVQLQGMWVDELSVPGSAPVEQAGA